MRRWSLLYAILKLLFGSIHRLFYRKIIVTGKENIPKDVPLIIAPNHQNALMDPLAIIFSSSLQPVFLARADIFRKAFFRFLLKSIKMLPVYRVRDGIGNISRNDETFEGTSKILEAKQCVALFPEAQHHGARFLLPLRKAVPRIAFLAEEKHNFNLDIHVIPAGINFSNYGNFRTVLQVNYGAPIKVNSFQKEYEESQVNGFNALREKLSESMRPLMIDIQDREYYDTIDILRKIYNKPMQQILNIESKQKPAWFDTEKEIIKRFDQLDETEKSTLRDAIETFITQTKKTGIKPKIALADIKSNTVLRIEKLKLLLGAPIFIIGYLAGLLPYGLSNLMMGKIKDKQYDSTFRFIISAIALPSVYVSYAILMEKLLHIGWWSILVFFLLFHLGTFALDYKKWFKALSDQMKMRKLSTQAHHPLIKSRKKILKLLNQTIGIQKA